MNALDGIETRGPIQLQIHKYDVRPVLVIQTYRFFPGAGFSDHPHPSERFKQAAQRNPGRK